jgi:hypothetical protein
MSRARTWNLRLNIDEFNALFLSCVSDTNKLSFMHGFSCGINNGVLAQNMDGMFIEGFTLGKRMRDEAEEYRLEKSTVGKKGGYPKHKVQNVPTGIPDGIAEVYQESTTSVPNPQSFKQKITITPLTPQRGEVETKAKKPRKQKFQSEDISDENAKYLKVVYERVPSNNPTSHEEVHKGPYAEAARVFQQIVDSGEATGQELYWAGRLYYEAEDLDGACGGGWLAKANRAWDYRTKFMVHVSTFYGPQKRTYRQFLPIAKEFITAKEHTAQEATV